MQNALDYIQAIKMHKKLKNDDIKQFILGQVDRLNLEKYIKNIDFDKLFMDIAVYNPNNKKIIIDESQLINSFFHSYLNLNKLNLIKNFTIRSYNDFYNLKTINIIFHEISHALQYKKMDEENSPVTLLLDASCNFIENSGSCYSAFHDRYYMEYNAHINAILLTFDFIDNIGEKTFYKKALESLNMELVTQILNGYGINNEKDFLYSYYPSPIDFFKYFFKKFPTYKTEDELKYFIETVYLENNINDLINGYYVPEDILNELKLIQNGQIKTTNFIENVKNKFNDLKKDNHI